MPRSRPKLPKATEDLYNEVVEVLRVNTRGGSKPPVPLAFDPGYPEIRLERVFRHPPGIVMVSLQMEFPAELLDR